MLDTRPYGRTGQTVTALGLGGSPINQSSRADGAAAIRRALELGITYFDTSPGYGAGESQLIYGEAMEGRTERVVMATKLGYLPDPADFRSERALRAQIEDNLRRLRRRSVDTLQVHEADWACWWKGGVAKGEPIRDEVDYDFADAPVMRVLRQARKQGLCRFIGITGNNAQRMTRILRAVEVDTLLVAFNYDLLWRRARTEAIPLALQKGAAIILGGVFRYGELARMHPEWRDAPPAWLTPEVRLHLDGLYDIQRESGLSLVELTIRFLVADARPSVILVGAATTRELEESIHAAEQGPLPPALHAQVEKLGMPD